jgi:hypothetical protein
VTREAPLEDLLLQAVNAEGGLCLKMNAALYRGIPDRLLLLPGRRLQFVELKADDGRPSVHQIRFRETLFSLGFPSVIIKGKTQTQEFIDDFVKGFF